MDKSIVEKHESFGLVCFNRSYYSGMKGARLFQSSIDNSTVITLCIKRAKLEHSLHRDKVYEQEELIQVEMSAAQFAELITSMNMGSGVPCTIKHVAGKRMEAVPDIKAESTKILDSFKTDSNYLVEKMNENFNQVKEILSKEGSITKKDREAIHNLMENTKMQVKSNMPFILDSFQESVDKTVTQAKLEVDSFVTHTATKLGLSELAKKTNMLLLETSSDEGKI